MKILGIGGSPRRGGNTDMLLDSALEGAESKGALTTKIILNDLEIKGCQECGRCGRVGICMVRDGMQTVYKNIEEADAIIVASPIFFGSLSAQLKMMIDRLHCLWVLKYVLKNSLSRKKRRKGIFLCVGGAREKKFFENARQIIKTFFATLDIDYTGDLYYGGIDKAFAIRQRRGALEKAFGLGAALVKAKRA